MSSGTLRISRVDNVTFEYLENQKATPISGSRGKAAVRIRASCFPRDDLYLFRCEKRLATENEPLHPKPLPPLEKKWCCFPPQVPGYVEVALTLANGERQRIKVNLNSIATRCSQSEGKRVTTQDVYEACRENRFEMFLLTIADRFQENQAGSLGDIPLDSDKIVHFGGEEDDPEDSILLSATDVSRRPGLRSFFTDGSPRDQMLAKEWAQKLHPLTVESNFPEENIRSTVRFLIEESKKWPDLCKRENRSSLFFPADRSKKNKFDIEYFDQDGAIFVYYPGRDGKTIGINLVGDLIVAERVGCKEIQFPILERCSQTDFQETPGIPKIYRVSKSSGKHHFLQERYLDKLSELLLPPRTNTLRRKNSSLSNLTLFSLKAKVKIAEDLLSALTKLHEEKMFHFSIDPAALIIERGKDFEVKAFIGRFDLIQSAKDLSSPFTKLADEYRPPETIDDGAYFLWDVYSLGASLRVLFNSPEFMDDPTNLKEKAMGIIAAMTAPLPNRVTAAKALIQFKEIKGNF